MAQLQVRQRGEVLRVLPLEMRHLSIGRTPDNGLPLRDTSVAVRHAEITEEGGVLLLTALAGDQALTYVNGQRLAAHQPHRLEHGDEIQIGPFTVAFLTAEQAPRPAEAARPRVVQGELGAHPAHPPFPTYPAHVPPRTAPSLYTQFLPPLFQESEFLSRYLKIFEVIWEPLQVRQDHLEAHFDARLAPPQMLPWMAQWLGVPLDPHWPEARQRAWMREAVSLYRWRGTRYGLTRALETVYGLSPVLEEDPSQPHTLEVRVLDSLDGPDTANREAITRFVHQHAPAHTRVTVTFVDAPESPGADEPAPPFAGTPA
ncbi:phage tail protein [Deinococcus hohokamensis]|uniref:Phage tail protein n=1 Tax=Deinococcus hohokamensis TaxID=309883 RepID=A0ABV9IBM3_9DEIO